MSDYFPWHLNTLTQLLSRARAKNLPHALIFTGNSGLGKLRFAKQFSQLLLCESIDISAEDYQEPPRPCGVCHSCNLFRADNHPDLNVVVSESEQGTIAVDQIRQLRDFFTLKSQGVGAKIAIITAADKMNKFAANSLLKTLEEPTKNSYLLLISHSPYRLLPTIRSRCQLINFTNPNVNDAVAWLETQGVKLETKEMLQLLNIALQYAKSNTLNQYYDFISLLEKLLLKQLDPVSAGKKCGDLGLHLVTNWLAICTNTLIRLKLGAVPVDISNGDIGLGNHAIIADLDVISLYRYLDKLIDYTRLLETQINTQLALEDILIEWSQLIDAPTRKLIA